LWIVFLCLAMVGCGEPSEDRGADLDNIAPIAVLLAPLRADVGEPVLFDARESRDEDGEIVEYWFEVGDGGPLLESVSPEIYHTFVDVGTYTVTLHVIDDVGAKDTDRTEVEVR
jgi:hypothetical protein